MAVKSTNERIYPMAGFHHLDLIGIMYSNIDSISNSLLLDLNRLQLLHPCSNLYIAGFSNLGRRDEQ